MDYLMKLIANISTLFTELPFCDRIIAARDAGFEGIEMQFPYLENLAEIQRTCAECDMKIELINLPAGNPDVGDVGLAALPERREEFLKSLDLAFEWAEALEVKKVNVLSGKPGGNNYDLNFDTLVENLRNAAGVFSKINVQVQLEVINSIDVPGFFAGNLQTGLSVVKKADHPNLRLQFDFYHMVRLGHSLVDATHQVNELIGHVQFADVPGRHEPGSGDIDFAAAMKALKSIGYNGAISAEYFPKGRTADSLDWMSDFKQML